MIALITGASSGIGREFVKQVDRKNFSEIWLVARRKDRLVDLSKNLKTKTKILDLDLYDDKSYEILEKNLKEENKSIGLLVNSAGLGYPDYFCNLSLEENTNTLDINCKALTKISYLCIKYMEKNSIIINIASVAAFLPQAKFAVYAASKSYVLSFSRALNRELKKRQIHVCCLCPNPVDTEFFKNSKKEDANNIKALGMENLEKMVEKTLRLCKKKDLITSHPISLLIRFLSKILPHSFIMDVEKLIGLY